MTETINLILALATIAMGCIGFISPRYAADALDLTTTKSTMGLTELRAGSGALFIGLGLGAILIGSPIAYATMGCAYAGAGVGRLTSILRDKPPMKKAGFFFAVEAIFGLWLIFANL
ncbi:protein of unknown function [Poseidonocella pacifica]|uniref:DUF4345 domain-containing protein n=1 Tax=Poseidonocella pacifica TaxID=871651 RepID=A0A1I0VQJ0_9RHOB|nr:DUF4345 family protein [Poseidonocella pacifica]SFA78604.1 protein of unknown function [Poseidonocella pacifica]